MSTHDFDRSHKALDLENTSCTLARTELGMSIYRDGDKSDCQFIQQNLSGFSFYNKLVFEFFGSMIVASCRTFSIMAEPTG